ncbi:hypothetical protein P692DRAFT_201811342 [Suillus brevipes Sb2]|nr:hypothetical protein P692DRAFT_201811342 [Suillus brevipes Sb2]
MTDNVVVQGWLFSDVEDTFSRRASVPVSQQRNTSSNLCEAIEVTPKAQAGRIKEGYLTIFNSSHCCGSGSLLTDKNWGVKLLLIQAKLGPLYRQNQWLCYYIPTYQAGVTKPNEAKYGYESALRG